ncbi:MAG TPA: cell division protein FtsH, partial [Anaerolineae bacterium]|nr:cell division protein FtsH [Anaerolineae bacterium]
MSGGRFRNIFVYLIILVAAVFLVFNFSSQSKKVDEVPISEIAAAAKEGKIERIVVFGDHSSLKVEFRGSKEPILSRKAEDADIIEVLRNLGVSEEEIAAITIEYQAPSGWASWMNLLAGILPALLFVGLFYFMLRQAQGTNSQAFSFGKSRARLFTG